MSLTPMLQQYLAIKKKYPDTFLFFRLGDFYEMFFDDATRGAEILDITLTARGKNHGKAIPMCGVPFHSAQAYINRLTQEGHKVAICEQVEDPASAKGIVDRKVVRIITPGTNLEDDAPGTGTNNYIAAVYREKNRTGLAYLDLATGEFNITECGKTEQLINHLSVIAPSELITTETVSHDPALKNFLAQNMKIPLTTYEAWIFEPEHANHLIKETFSLFSLEGLGIAEYPAGVSAAGALLYYLRDNLYEKLGHLKQPRPIVQHEYLRMDRHTIDHLGLFPSRNRTAKGHSLFEVLNKTKTAMGTRLLAQWLTRPLLDRTTLETRHAAVATLVKKPVCITTLQDALRRIRDIERILGRLTCGISNPRDMVSLRESLDTLPALRSILTETGEDILAAIGKTITLFPELSALLNRAIVENPPAIIKNGRFIQRGFNPELDELVTISSQAREWIAALQAQEIERTGIKSLKIKFNKVFGFYIEVTKTNLSMVPADYERKQTLVNAERFTIPLLKEYETKILGADERAIRLEEELFEQLRSDIIAQAAALQTLSERIAALDVLTSFARCAAENDYTRPVFSDTNNLRITGGRHPVVEKTLPENHFVENDLSCIRGSQDVLVITGPNMSGKSTYLRQNALITLMAQIGSFVPAAKAQIGITDKIFTRIGASDNVTAGESTFMVEMIETAHILHNATERSLVIMDEVGRGTSTFDGVSIAWAICEFFAEQPQPPKVLFATHYHELSELEGYFPCIKNFNATVQDTDRGIVFLRKISRGAADKSYGIHVAELAGLPKAVTERAKEVLNCIETEKHDKEELAERIHRNTKTLTTEKTDISSLPLFQSAIEEHPVLQKIRACDILSLSPLDALNLLNALKEELAREEKKVASDK